MVNVERVSLSFPKFLLNELDNIVKSKNYSSRSELIRDAVRKYVLENNSLKSEGKVNGLITVVYEPSKEIMEEMSNIYFEYNEVIKSMNHSYVKTACNKNKKLESFVVEGDSKLISSFYVRVQNISGKIYDNILIF
ncbi:putative transcriptional regulator, CopG family [Methanococcus vannielii SB]|uniref:Transcriptional regulator, CopG family n=1 Tax=Methanococcus vannielii (strain ATCC 35089 / DSM 1224 / JCM 13029 / OCM 148 / SB) TaxID=406327 RepID=A6USL4_METVS|nr:CopG family ribbon-helix-helix protein [Methanococcus vannielii]ABR55486.1 putative transcriptional regulator, CopG family [Methanococcus vannielii SB]